MKSLVILTVMAATIIMVGRAFQQRSEEGVLDAPMTMLRPDGRNIDQISVFELARLASNATGTHSQGVDVTMKMMWDYNHVVGLRLPSTNHTLYLIPSTGTQDVILMHRDCKECWTMHGSKWTPDVDLTLGTHQSAKGFDFFYMQKLRESQLQGHYYLAHACLVQEKKSCASNLVVYAVQSASPWFYCLGDGYLGLAPGPGRSDDSLDDSHNTLLDQMKFHSMISKKQFGVHTHLFNSTEDPSELRFGGYNQDLFKEGQEQMWIRTVGPSSWEIKFNTVQFYTDSFQSLQHALINPGYPYIAMPVGDFKKFKDDLAEIYPEERISCNSTDWCYFVTPCADLVDRMPPLVFEFPVSGLGLVEFSVPAKSFLVPDVDKHTNVTTCHLGIVGNKLDRDQNYWVLGQSFMENFYVTFDAEDASQLRIGISNYPPVPWYNNEDAIIFYLGISIAIALVGCFALLGVWICIRELQQRRLERAKAYFKALKAQSHDEPDEKELVTTADPNSFVKVNNDDSSEDSDQEFPTTANEQAIGSLLDL